MAPDVWMVQGASAMGSPANRNFISNATFLVTREGVVLVDALGAPALAEELLAAIARVTRQPVRTVIVTHYHADHIYGLQVFKDRGATIVAHQAAREYLLGEAAQQRLAVSREQLGPWIDARTRLQGADRWLDAPWSFKLGGVTFEVLPVGPAHTPEDLVVVLPGKRVVIAGDLVFRGRLPFVGQADSARWIESLDRLIALAPRALVPGHGPVSTNAAADLQFTREYLAELRRTMGEAARNLEPFDDAYARADWSRWAQMPLFAATHRMNAYNTYLLMERSGR